MNPRERLHIPQNEDYRVLEIDEEYEIDQEDETLNEFNVDPTPALDALVGDAIIDTNDAPIPQKTKRKSKEKPVKWTPWSGRGQIDPDFDDT